MDQEGPFWELRTSQLRRLLEAESDAAVAAHFQVSIPTVRRLRAHMQIPQKRGRGPGEAGLPVPEKETGA